MRIRELNEMEVFSSWIEILTYDNGSVIMQLLNGNEYEIDRVSMGLYSRWVSAPSKGKFWHRNLRGRYHVTRVA